MSSSRALVNDLIELAKVRLNSLVVAVTAGGYYMGSSGTIEPVSLALVCVGTALVAGGASAINQVMERDLDRLMMRTQRRPLADGRLTPQQGLVFSAALAIIGIALLMIAANVLSAGIAAITFLIYWLAYTPLKRVTSLATIVGAVPGALPPLIGWTAATDSLAGVAPWTLFLVMFLWQLPHFLAIAWLYREDYTRARLPMLPVVDRTGRLTGFQALLWAATLVPFSELPFLAGLATRAYAVSALVLGFFLVVPAFFFALRRTDSNARRLFLGSLVYLPLLWIAMGIWRK
jgi:protoheme IX farnesyltransferase